jgi:hypothetical protein
MKGYVAPLLISKLKLGGCEKMISEIEPDSIGLLLVYRTKKAAKENTPKRLWPSISEVSNIRDVSKGE